MTSEIEVRTVNLEKDIGFIFSTWLKSYQQSAFVQGIYPEVFYQQHHKAIESILKRDNAVGIVAYPKGEPDVLLGYLVGEAGPVPVIHYIYVKGVFRKKGIAKLLIEASLLPIGSSFFTHWTYVVNLLIKKAPGLKYDPYRL
jgi:GNAT superfamily N-acetyltransferase